MPKTLVYSATYQHLPDGEIIENGSSAIGERERAEMEHHFAWIKAYNQSVGRDFTYEIHQANSQERKREIHIRRKTMKQDFWSNVDKALWLAEDLARGCYRFFKQNKF